jgi:hypothetical protein
MLEAGEEAGCLPLLHVCRGRQRHEQEDEGELRLHG